MFQLKEFQTRFDTSFIHIYSCNWVAVHVSSQIWGTGHLEDMEHFSGEVCHGISTQ